MGKMGTEFKATVQLGYDQLAQRGKDWARPLGRRKDKAKYAQIFHESMQPGARVLELGCGSGGRTTQNLAHKFKLVGVDLSREQLRLAQQSVPNASLIQADMASIHFQSSSFDGVVAFFSFIHVPSDEQAGLIHSIYDWLRPGGTLVATMGSKCNETDFTEDFMGVSMYWSSLGAEANKILVKQAGFELVSADEETEMEFGSPVTFLWIVARKPVT